MKSFPGGRADSASRRKAQKARAMPLISLSKMLDAALKGKYAAGYFESWNLESLKAVSGGWDENLSFCACGQHDTGK